MAKYRPIKTEIWNNDWFHSLKPEEKLIWVFLLTNDRTTLCGIYRVSIGYIYRMTKVSEEVIKEVLNKFEKDDKAKLIEGKWISIKNLVKHHSKSAKITEGILREVEDIPESILVKAYPIHRVGINLNFNLTKLKPNLTSTELNSNEKKINNDYQEFLKKTAKAKSI